MSHCLFTIVRNLSPSIWPTMHGNAFPTCRHWLMIGPTNSNSSGRKDIKHFEKRINSYLRLPAASKPAELARMQAQIDPRTPGDTNYSAIRKNYLSFVKQMQMIDSAGELTERGLAMYHLGLVNGPTRKGFYINPRNILNRDCRKCCEDRRGNQFGCVQYFKRVTTNMINLLEIVIVQYQVKKWYWKILMLRPKVACWL